MPGLPEFADSEVSALCNPSPEILLTQCRLNWSWDRSKRISAQEIA